MSKSDSRSRIDLINTDGDGEAAGGGSGDQGPPETTRPSLITLTREIRELREELRAGFPSRRDVLFWIQRLTVRSLGQVPQRYYRELARQFRLEHIEGGEGQGVLLAALLTPDARRRNLATVVDESGLSRLFTGRSEVEIEEEVTRRLRVRLAASMIRPAYDSAYRALRKDATSYGDEAGEGEAHDPRNQRFTLMRPGFDELDEWQSVALSELLDGFEDREAVLKWGDVLQTATNGEINQTSIRQGHERDFVDDVLKERSSLSLLLASEREAARGREVFAAVYLCPAFNLGVREQLRRSTEVPTRGAGSEEVKTV